MPSNLSLIQFSPEELIETNLCHIRKVHLPYIAESMITIDDGIKPLPVLMHSSKDRSYDLKVIKDEYCPILMLKLQLWFNKEMREYNISTSPANIETIMAMTDIGNLIKLLYLKNTKFNNFKNVYLLVSFDI